MDFRELINHLANAKNQLSSQPHPDNRFVARKSHVAGPISGVRLAATEAFERRCTAECRSGRITSQALKRHHNLATVCVRARARAFDTIFGRILRRDSATEQRGSAHRCHILSEDVRQGLADCMLAPRHIAEERQGTSLAAPVLCASPLIGVR